MTSEEGRRDTVLKGIFPSLVHRGQSHLLDEGAIARVGMKKVESGVRLCQEQQLWIALVDTALEQGKSLIALAEPPVQVCKLERGDPPGPRPLFNRRQLQTNHSSIPAGLECTPNSGRLGKISFSGNLAGQ